MLKMAGFLLLQLAALLFAAQRVQGRSRQQAELRSVCAMLEQLRGILEAESSPMPELLQTLSRRCDGGAAAFVQELDASLDALGERSFQELWRQALLRSPIGQDENAARELEALGAVLGRYELPAQLEAVSSCLDALRSQTEHWRQELPRLNRLTWGLSFSVSMLFGILLL